MNQVLRELEETGRTNLPSGRSVPLHSHIGPKSGRVIRNAIELTRPKVACEVGLAFGVSTLYILETMRVNGQGMLIGMDPAQHDDTWQGGGLHNIRRAGFGDRYRFFEERSQRVLPRLEADGTRIQFGFVDGWHTFDHGLVDFFFLDQMMDPGGIIVMDDAGYPSLARLCHFIVTNRAYEIVDMDQRIFDTSVKCKVKSVAKQLCRPLVRDNFTPTSDARRLEEQVNVAQLLALRKISNDRRSFDHFVAF